MNSAIYPILQFLPHTQVLLCKIECSNEIREKLRSMGIEENILVTILRGSKKNALIILKRHNRRIMLRCNKNLIILAKEE